MRTTTDADGLRPCRECGGHFPADGEHFAAYTWNERQRLGSYCKACNAARAKRHYQDNRDRARARMADYRKEHREESRTYFRENGRRFRQKQEAKTKARYQLRRAEHLAAAHRRYAANRQRYIDGARAWAQANPEKASRHMRVKNLRRRGAPMDAEAKAYAQALLRDPCAYCGTASQIVIDHIAAIARGGDSRASNLTAACRRCNAAKSNKPLLIYLLERRGS